ncbi:hypothetical protein AYI81_21210 [Shewanella algae]|nr:hypothetical protein AYI80_21235 [Shewanella algae]TXS81995.1 hypothetical protein AYI81_21210 [Shewanella algae]
MICGAGLDGQEWQLGPGCFSCSVPGGDLRRRQWSAPGIGLDGQEWQLARDISVAVKSFH